MTLTIQNYDGLQALDAVQFIQTTLDTGVTSGLDVTLDTAAADLTFDVDAGEAWLDGTPLTIGAQQITLPDGDVDWPRKDVLYVTPAEELASKQGTPREPDPEEVEAEQTQRPETPEFEPLEGVPFAEVWIPSKANDPADLEVDFIRDRRLRPWPTKVLTDEEDFVVASMDENITGSWTFSAGVSVPNEPISNQGNNVLTSTAGVIDTTLLADNAVETAKINDGSVTNQKLAAGDVGITTLSPKTVELDASSTSNNAYTDPVFVPAGKTAELYAWGKQLTDGTADTNVEMRFPGVTETGEYAEDTNGIASYTNNGGDLDVIEVELVNTGATAYTASSGDADGVRFAHSVRVS